MERFAPGVMIDGERYEPPGWMWILAFALAGVPWAVEEIKRDEPAFKALIRAWLREQKLQGLKEQLQYFRDLQARIERDYDKRIEATLREIDNMLEGRK